MSPYWMVESALRALLMGVAIFAALKLLRIRQVRAQRTAWVLALLAALAMPTLLHWPMGLQLPAISMPAVGAPARSVSASPFGESTAAALAGDPVAASGSLKESRFIAKPSAKKIERSSVPGRQRVAAQALSMRAVDQPDSRPDSPVVKPVAVSAAITILSRLWRSSLAVYLFIAAILLTRLVVGIGLALRLRSRASAFETAMVLKDDIRISDKIQMPVTIGSTILLPVSSAEWDAAKLSVVLAHERAHVQQADFYIHLLAGVHCALFWFSPFSWWLQRRLSALGEAMSDLAALAHAESRSSYAEVLLEFATSARQPIGAVAMARTSNLRPRIERLLNDRLFREAVAGTPRQLFLAASVVPFALLASVSLVRVQAAERASVADHPVLAAAGLQSFSPAPAPIAAPSPSAASADQASAEPQAAPAPAASSNENERNKNEDQQASSDALSRSDSHSEAELNQQLEELLARDHIDSKQREALVKMAAELATQHAQLTAEAIMARSTELANWLVLLSENKPQTAQATTTSESESSAQGTGTSQSGSYSYSYSGDGEAFAFVNGDDSYKFTFSGNWDKMFRFEDIRRKTRGAFIYYRHAGKSYVIQDPALIAQAQALYAPMEALGKKQEVLARQQEVLGARQEALRRQQEAVKVPTPDFTKELASLDQAMQKLKQLQASKDVTQENLAEVQGEIGEIQGRLGELQGEAGETQGKFGEEQGKLGEEQGKLGEEQGRLGNQQGEMAKAARHKLQPEIDREIRDGRVKPID